MSNPLEKLKKIQAALSPEGMIKGLVSDLSPKVVEQIRKMEEQHNCKVGYFLSQHDGQLVLSVVPFDFNVNQGKVILEKPLMSGGLEMLIEKPKDTA